MSYRKLVMCPPSSTYLCNFRNSYLKEIKLQDCKYFWNFWSIQLQQIMFKNKNFKQICLNFKLSFNISRVSHFASYVKQILCFPLNVFFVSARPSNNFHENFICVITSSFCNFINITSYKPSPTKQLFLNSTKLPPNLACSPAKTNRIKCKSIWRKCNSRKWDWTSMGRIIGDARIIWRNENDSLRNFILLIENVSTQARNSRFSCRCFKSCADGGFPSTVSAAPHASSKMAVRLVSGHHLHEFCERKISRFHVIRVTRNYKETNKCVKNNTLCCSSNKNV